MNHTIIELENALRSALTSAMPHVPTIATYDGRVLDGIERKTVRLPAILIQFDGIDYAHEGEYDLQTVTWEKVVHFNLILIAESLRSETSQRERADQGAYAMISAAEEALLGKRLNLASVHEIVIDSIEPVVTDLRDMAVYMIRIKWPMLHDING